MFTCGPALLGGGILARPFRQLDWQNPRAPRRGLPTVEIGSLALALNKDPSFSQVAFLSHWDAYNISPAVACVVGGATTGTNGCTLSATQVKFGAQSLDCTSTSTSLSQPSGNGGTNGWATASTFGPTTNDFMFEGWFYTNTVTIAQGIMTIGHNGSGTRQLIYMASDGSLRYMFNAVDRITGAASGVSINAWHFWQLQRIGTTTQLALDGTQVGSNYTDSNNYPAEAVWFGADNNVGTAVAGHTYFDDTRLTVGTGRTINLPTAAFSGY